MDRSLDQAKPKRPCGIAQHALGRMNEAMALPALLASFHCLPGPTRISRASSARRHRPCYRADPLPRRPGGTEQWGTRFARTNP
jgi:hypothetical protein